jgi:hypothetical protein
MSVFEEFRAAFVFVVIDRTKRTGVNRDKKKARIHEVRDRLLAIRDIKIVDELLGSYDLICYVEARDSQDFLETLDIGIGALKDEKLISHTETMMIWGSRLTLPTKTEQPIYPRGSCSIRRSAIRMSSRDGFSKLTG